MKRASAREWARRVERWEASGLTAEAFAARYGLKASRLVRWRRQLRVSSDGVRNGLGFPGGTHGRKTASARVTARGEAGEGSTFLELPTALLASSADPSLELVFNNGLRVRVPVGFDEPTLTRVLRAVEASQ
jgi:transposase